MSREFIFPMRIYYEDTDAEGVVYYANYLKFMERARTEWCRQLGLPLSHLADEGILLVVRSAAIEYLRPARLDDSVEVVSTVAEMGRVKIVFEHIVRSVDDPELIYCKGIVTVVSVDKKLQPCRLLPKIIEGMSSDN